MTATDLQDQLVTQLGSQEAVEAWKAERQAAVERRISSRLQVGGWYAFVCDSTPANQIRAADEVRRSAYKVFCPIRTEWRSSNKFEKTKRKKEEKIYAVFPGYIFIRMPRNHLSPFFRSKPDAIYSVLANDGEPIVCSDEMIRKEADRYGEQHAPAHYRYMQTNHEFEAGDTVKLDRLGIHVRIEEISGNRVKAVGDFLGGKDIPFNCDAWDLRKLG